MGREVNGMNAQVEKDLNVDKYRELTDEYPGHSGRESFKTYSQESAVTWQRKGINSTGVN